MSCNTLYTKEEYNQYYESSSWLDYRNWLADVIKYSEPGPILDVGAGLGYFTECANNYGLNCIGIEGNEWACNDARKRGVPIILCMLESKWPFEDSSFTTIMCNQVIEHLPDIVVRYVLQESHRVLKSGGVLMLYSPSCYNRAERENPAHINLFSPSRLCKEVELAGFEIRDEPNYLERAGLIWRIIYRGVNVIYSPASERFLASANCIARKI